MKKKKPGRAAKKRTKTKVTARSRLTDFQKKTVDILHSMAKPGKIEAYRLAGGEQTGHTASVEVQKMFNKPHVDAYHKSLQKIATDNAIKKEAAIITEMELLAFSNIADYLSFGSNVETEGGHKDGVVLKNSDQLTREQMACISEVSETYTKHGRRRVTFKLYDKKGALELLGRRHGCFPNKVDVGDKTVKSLADIVAVMMGKDGSKS